MNKQAILEKQAQVDLVTETMRTTKSLTIIEYRGLTVAKLEKLRRDLRKEGAEIKVFKNSLVERAIDALGYNELDEQIAGPNAFVFSHQDPIAAPKLLVKFAKANEQMKIKGGIVEGKVVTDKEIRTLATLPNREGMLSMLLGCLMAPVRNFAATVQAVADKHQ